MPTALPSTEEAVSPPALSPESESFVPAPATARPDASALVPCPERDDTEETCLPNDMVRLVGFVGIDALTGHPILNRGTGKTRILLNDSAGNPFTDLLREPNRLIIVDGTLTSMEPPTISVIRHYGAAGAPGSETWLPELYTNSQVDFAIQYPSGWIVQDDTAMSGGIVSIQNYHSADLPFPGLEDPALYKVEIVPIMRSQATALAEMRSGIEGQVVREQSLTINNLSAIRLTVDTELHGRTQILLVQLPDRVLLLQTWQGAALFDRIIETLRASSVPALPADPVLTWKRELDGRCATVVMDANGRAGFGPCSAPDRFSSILREATRPEDLQHFLERYQPFESTTPEGQIVFKGRGDQVVSPAEQRAIANWAGLVQQELEYGRSGASWGMALAIVQDSLDPCVGMQMQRSGQFVAHDCRIGLESTGWRWMTADQLAQLYTWLDTFRAFEVPFTVAGQRVRFVFSGQGLQEATPAEQQAIFDWAKAVYTPSPSPTPTIAPGALVKALPAPAVSLAVDPRDPNVVYALLVTDALYRSNDRVQTWQRLAFPAAERPFELPLDPQNRNVIFMLPAQDIRFAPDAQRLFVRAGQALYRSDDRGATWQQIQDRVGAWTLASADGNSLYVARGVGVRDESGVYRSDDGGQSWQRMYAGFFPPFLQAERFNPAHEGITSLLADPSAPTTLYAGTDVGFYRSRDAGKTWEEFNAGLPPTQRVYRWVPLLTAAADNVFALTDVAPDDNSYQRIVVRLQENGWAVVATLPHCADNTCDVQALVADATDPKRLYLGTRQGLTVTDDAGATWRPMPVAGAVYRVSIAPSEPSQLYLWTEHGFAAVTASPP